MASSYQNSFWQPGKLAAAVPLGTPLPIGAGRKFFVGAGAPAPLGIGPTLTCPRVGHPLFSVLVDDDWLGGVGGQIRFGIRNGDIARVAGRTEILRRAGQRAALQ